MSKQKSFLYFIIASIILLTIGLFLPSKIALVLSVLYFAGVAWLRPKWLIPLLFIYFPLRPFLVEVNDGLKLAGDIGILVLVAKVVIDAVRAKNYRSIFKLEWYEWAYLLFCVIGTISALQTGVSLVAIVFQLRKFLTMYLLFYGVKRLVWDNMDVDRILKIIISVATLLSLHGFVEKLSQRQWLIPRTWMEGFISPANAERIYGLLGNPNSMGLFMAVSIVASLVLLRTTSKRVWYIPLALSVGTFLLSFSRGSWIAIVIAVIVYLALARKKGMLKQVIIGVAAGYVLVFLPINFADGFIVSNFGDQIEQRAIEINKGSTLGGRFGSSFNEETLSRSANTGRLFFVKKGIEVLKDYPMIGTGFATFGDSAALVYSSPIYEKYGLKGIYDYMGRDFYSDNQYIQVIAQTGVIGTIVFAVFLLHMLYSIWTMRETHKDIAQITFAFWLFICIAGVFYNIWENQVFPMVFFTLLAWLETKRNEHIDNTTK